MVAVYLAAALSCAPRMRDWAQVLSDNGLAVCSRWHHTGDRVDPHAPQVRCEILLANLSDLNRADIVFCDTTEGQPACTFVEIGYAIALGKRVVWRQPAGPRNDGVRARCIADAHPFVTIVASDSEAVLALLRVANGIYDASERPTLKP